MTMASSSSKSIGLEFAEWKLESSGISLDQAKELGMTVEQGSNLDARFHNVKGLRIPYYDLEGSETGFFRFRYLEELPGFLASLQKPQRYVQVKGSLNWVYLPRLKDFPWPDIAADTTAPLFITEGELKAACACIVGYPTIALGGVDVWQSIKHSMPLLPPLDQFEWKGRRVYIVFDSDAATNVDVASAQIRLSNMLLRLGAEPKTISLPSTREGKKQGLDDFLVAGGDLDPLIDEATTLHLAAALTELNNNFAYVLEQDLVVELETARRIKRDSLINGFLANRRCVEYRPGKGGKNIRTEVSVPQEWLRWPCRRDVSNLTYEPEKPRITLENNFNLWPGWGCEPEPGNVDPWNELLEFIFEDAPEEREWFEKWCAYPIQNPGTKMYSSVLIWGPDTGTGKSLLGFTLGRIYGKNFTKIGNAELHSTFNDYAVGKQFIVGEEITGSDKRTDADKLKDMITQPILRINAKFMPAYELPDTINYYFTSNHPDAFFLDDQDRRFFIRMVRSKAKSREFYLKYVDWLNNGGAAHLFSHLLAIEMGTWSPTAPAMVTTSKVEMMQDGKSDLAIFIHNMRQNMDHELGRLAEILKLKETPDIVLNKHLKMLYDPENSSRVTANGIGRELKRAGFKTLGSGLMTETFGYQRFYVMRNIEEWDRKPLKDIREYIDRVYAPLSPLKKGKY